MSQKTNRESLSFIFDLRLEEYEEVNLPWMWNVFCWIVSYKDGRNKREKTDHGGGCPGVLHLVLNKFLSASQRVVFDKVLCQKRVREEHGRSSSVESTRVSASLVHQISFQV